MPSSRRRRGRTTPTASQRCRRLPANCPPDLLRYTLPSRYCDSDKLTDFAWKQFGNIEHGMPRVQAISHWVHDNIEYRYLSGRPDISASDVLQRGYGVCRDFAHLAIALNRTFNLPARYVTGHLPDIGFPDPDNHMDFHAYAEVYIGGTLVHDGRAVPRAAHRPHQGSCGQDAVDGAFSTIYGGANLTYFRGLGLSGGARDGRHWRPGRSHEASRQPVGGDERHLDARAHLAVLGARADVARARRLRYGACWLAAFARDARNRERAVFHRGPAAPQGLPARCILRRVRWSAASSPEPDATSVPPRASEWSTRRRASARPRWPARSRHPSPARRPGSRDESWPRFAPNRSTSSTCFIAAVSASARSCGSALSRVS